MNQPAESKHENHEYERCRKYEMFIAVPSSSASSFSLLPFAKEYSNAWIWSICVQCNTEISNSCEMVAGAETVKQTCVRTKRLAWLAEHPGPFLPNRTCMNFTNAYLTLKSVWRSRSKHRRRRHDELKLMCAALQCCAIFHATRANGTAVPGK